MNSLTPGSTRKLPRLRRNADKVAFVRFPTPKAKGPMGKQLVPVARALATLPSVPFANESTGPRANFRGLRPEILGICNL